MEGWPPHPFGHLHTALWPLASHSALFPQGLPSRHGFLHWYWTHALLSGHSESWLHSPFLTVEKFRQHYTKCNWNNSLFYSWETIKWLTRYTFGVRVTFCTRWAGTTRLMIRNRTSGSGAARILLNTGIDTSPISACLTEGTLIIWRASCLNRRCCERKRTKLRPSHLLII